MGSNPTLSAKWSSQAIRKPLKIGLVGLGKIAIEQHLPALAITDGVDLVAIASRNGVMAGLHRYRTLEQMLANEPVIDAIVLCQPPAARFEAARLAMMAGKHVFLEKPPGATVTEVNALAAMANAEHVTLFASWHSRFAPAVEPARRWVAAHAVTSIDIHWKEDIRIWHPGQDWILQRGGFGVFDPGINALSILTHITATPIRMTGATLHIPANQNAPIQVDLAMRATPNIAISAEFDFLQTGLPVWDIIVQAGTDQLRLERGGHALRINGVTQACAATAEYASVYQHFADLAAAGQSDVDVRPLQLVSDAFLIGDHQPAKPFIF